MDLENELMRQFLEAILRYERAKRAVAMRRCRSIETIIKQFENQSIIKGKHE